MLPVKNQQSAGKQEALLVGLVIPQLHEKLQLLITHGHHKNWQAIGKVLEKSPKTIKWWIGGSSVRTPNMVASKSVNDVMQLFATALPSLENTKTIRAMVLGPLSDLETALKTAAITTLSFLIEQEAKTGCGTLIRKTSKMGLVEIDKVQRSEPRFSVKAGEWFRIEFQTDLGNGHIIALQNIQQNWGLVPSCLNKQNKRLYLPDQDADNRPAFIREQRDIGINRFIAIQTVKHLPAELQSAEVEGVALDRTLLSHLAGFYSEQPISQRRIFLLELEIR